MMGIQKQKSSLTKKLMRLRKFILNGIFGFVC